MSSVRIMQGDCIEQMRLLPDNSVHAVVTDPPYGIGFMGKAWDGKEIEQRLDSRRGARSADDSAGPNGAHKSAAAQAGLYDLSPKAMRAFQQFSADWAREAFRVLKPGGHLVSFASTRTYHRMVCGIEEAGFEIRDCIRSLNGDDDRDHYPAWVFGCLDAATELLTRRGWIDYEDLTTADEVLQWSHQDGALTWVAPQAVHVHDFDGDMVVLENRHTRQVLTPNHRVYAKVKRHCRHAQATTYEVLQARELFDRSSAWSVDLPMAGVLRDGAHIEADYAYLVGWWLTDAWPHKSGNACMFSQCKPKQLEKLRAALAPHGASEYVRDRGNPNHSPEHTFYLSGPAADRLRSDFPDRALPWSVLGWHLEARTALYEGLMDGDGSREKGGQHAEAFWSQKQERRDVFMALALSLGIRAFERREKSVVHVNPSTCTTQLQNRHRVAAQPYCGKVWCITVPTGAFVVRRDGKPFITGNSGFPKSLNVAKAIESGGGRPEDIRRMQQGEAYSPSGRGRANYDHGAASAMGASAVDWTPASEAASQWQGWGTALKPAWEPICLARKPLEGTVAGNVLKHGTGGLNIDGCRIEGHVPKTVQGQSSRAGETYGADQRDQRVFEPNTAGRWPANVIHDGSPEVVAQFPQDAGAQSPVKGTEPTANGFSGTVYAQPGKAARAVNDRCDGGGSAARFFWCPKASPTDRHAGLENPGSQFQMGRLPNHAEKVNAAGKGNHHPTVKPTELMRYLVRLVTPPGGVVLDPFMGSGSTLKAADLEGFDAIGIDKDPAYCAIARQRIAADAPLFADIT